MNSFVLCPRVTDNCEKEPHLKIYYTSGSRLAVILVSLLVGCLWFASVSASDDEQGRYLKFRITRPLSPVTIFNGATCSSARDCWVYVLDSIEVDGRDPIGNQ